MSDKAEGRRFDTLVVFTVAIFLRLLYFYQGQENPLLYNPILDESYYVSLGRSVAAGYLMGENRTFYMDPLYGYFLGAVFYIFGENLTIARFIQIAADSINALFVYAIGRKVAGRNAGLWAGLLYAGYRVMFFHDVTVLKTTLTVSVALLFTMSIMSAAERPAWRRWGMAGFVCAMGVYLWGSLLLLAPVGLGVYYLVEKPGFHAFAKHSAIFMVVMLLAMFPGAARNYVAGGEFSPLNSQAGRLLYSCNNPENLSGGYNVPKFARANPVESETDFHREAERRTGRGMTTGEVSRYWTGETFAYLAANPSAMATLLYNKLKGAIGDYEIPDNHSYYQFARFSPMSRIPAPSFAFALALGAPGLWIAVRRNRKAAHTLAPIMTILATMVIFYTSSRFRAPVVPFLLIGAGMTLTAIWQWLSMKRYLMAAALVMLCGALFMVSRAVPEYASSGNEEYYLAKAYWKVSDLSGAHQVNTQGLRKFPDQARFYVLEGMIALSAGRPDRAEQYNDAAIKIDPASADAWHNLGLAQMAQGKPSDALQSLEHARTLAPNPLTTYAIAKASESAGDMRRALSNYRLYEKSARPGDPLVAKSREKIDEMERRVVK